MPDKPRKADTLYPQYLKTVPLSSMSALSPLDRLTRLYDIMRSLNSITQLDNLLNQIVASAVQMVDAHGGFLMLVDPESGNLRCEVTSGGVAAGLKGAVLNMDERTVPGWVALRGEPYCENDVPHNPFFAAQLKDSGSHSVQRLMCVPLRVQDRITGVVQVLDKLEGGDFNVDDLKLLEAMADTAAIAVENVRLFEEEHKKSDLLTKANEELLANYQGTLQALTGLLDARDTATRGHSNRVVALTMRLVRSMDITDPHRLRAIQLGALLHDVGKVGVPDAILRKAGPLDGEEWKQMRSHPELGYRLLKDIVFLKDALPVVRYHHERFNGTGYPYGLEGTQIPLEARIFAVADAFDAIISERPYKKARAFEQAIATIVSDSGKYFDPKVVEAFLRVPKEEWLQILDEAKETSLV
ncbi:MAG TPA: HD domain-containing phosphohydrolase [Chloroflexia bacterium]|nr:HD domain-containing phosphohydrolase [Chloroflexia bacterium]